MKVMLWFIVGFILIFTGICLLYGLIKNSLFGNVGMIFLSIVLLICGGWLMFRNS